MYKFRKFENLLLHVEEKHKKLVFLNIGVLVA